MPISAARAAAFDILLRVEGERAYASELLHSGHFSRLSPADHGLATELALGVLRWQPALDRKISGLSSQPIEKLDREVLIALRLGAYQLFFLDRVPGRAAVHESVELVKRARKHSAVPFANAILRKLATAASGEVHSFAHSTAPTPATLAEELAHPLWLVERWARQFGFEITRRICEFDQQIPEVSIFLADATAEDALRQANVQLEAGRFLSAARRVKSGEVTQTRAFRDGLVFIQDEASHLVALLTGSGTNILDCCAAPGNKTRVLAQRNPQANIVALDLHAHRASLLRRLVGARNVQVIAADARQMPVATQFDSILADVPCSGTGTLRRNPEIKWRLAPQDLADLQQRQLAILKSAMQQVAAGGRLVYSTCSLEPEENEEVISNVLSSDSSFRLLDCRADLERLRAEGVLTWMDLDSLLSGLFLRTIPGVHPCDGFFAAILQKH